MQQFQLDDELCKELYNPERKIAFLNYLISEKCVAESKVALNITFWKRMKKTEEINGKDFIDFTFAEVNQFFSNSKLTTFSSFHVYKSMASIYVDWCVKTGIYSSAEVHPVQRVMQGDTNSEIVIKSLFFKDFEHLDDCISAVYGLKSEEEHNYDMQILFLYLCWCGFSAKEIFYLRNENCDFAKNTITSEEGNYTAENVEPKIMSQVKKCMGMTKIGKQLLNQNNYLIRRGLRITNYTLPTGDDFKRSFYSKWKSLSKNLSIYNPYFGNKATPSSIMNSGLFNKLYQYQKETGIVLKSPKDFEGEPIKILRSSSIYELSGSYLSWVKAYYN